jgi:AraC-like DNA-binding protein
MAQNFTDEPSCPFVVPFIRWADIIDIPPNSSAPDRRRLYDHELVYVMAGDGHIVIEGMAHRAVPDRLFLVTPRLWHGYRADRGQTLTLLGVHFDWMPQQDTPLFTIFRAADDGHMPEEKLFRSARQVPGWDLSETPFLDLKGRPRVRRALEEVVAEYSLEDHEARSGAGALLAHAIVQIQREARLLRELKSGVAIGPDALRRLEQARALLEAPQNFSLSVDEAATHVGWSADHLRRAFRTVYRMSPGQAQTQARVRHARDLLRRENLPVAEVARRCGFEDAEYFTRVFKKETGLSPRQFLAFAKKM